MTLRPMATQEAEVDRAFAEAAAGLGSVDIAVACVGGGGTVDGKPVSTAGQVYTREQQIRGSGVSLDPLGPLS